MHYVIKEEGGGLLEVCGLESCRKSSILVKPNILKIQRRKNKKGAKWKGMDIEFADSGRFKRDGKGEVGGRRVFGIGGRNSTGEGKTNLVECTSIFHE